MVVGENTLGKRMKVISQQAELSTIHTNHSIRATTTTILDRTGAPNGNFRENICSEDDLRTRIFGSLFLAEIFEKVSFDPYNFRITRLSARKSEQMKSF